VLRRVMASLQRCGFLASNLAQIKAQRLSATCPLPGVPPHAPPLLPTRVGTRIDSS
jgi:hypothetical protein